MLLYSQSHLITQRAREMASFSKQATVFLVAALLLCLLCTRGQAARPGPVSSVYTSQVRPPCICNLYQHMDTCVRLHVPFNLVCIQFGNRSPLLVILHCSGSFRCMQGAKSAIAHEKRAAGTRMEMGQEDQALATRECEGGEGTEECLMRRTLVAHTDYIYTQGKHN